ncbi:fam-a protein [Plasmodium vinckei]|uniref:Fam-a protein n=1 Tax=Plasmodium vinckei TaxID=5860 RepID=A0A6V7T1I4_PLAVN|nr:fam-a protein [Plasmodium vinckei]
MNKFYIQIVLFLLSVSVYLSNKTLATEPALGNAPKTKSKNRYATSEEIYEKNKNLLCINPEETKHAEELMNEALTHLVHHATSKDGYKYDAEALFKDIFFYKKEHQGQNIVKAIYKKRDSNKYNELINEFWDPDIINVFDNKFAKKKITRVYNPNLVMIQRRYRYWRFGSEKYFYALAKKAQISEDRAIIVMASANINDHHPSKEEYKNTIIESANLFKTDIDSEDDIRNGQLEKKFLNIAGYLIEKKDKFVYITYIKSVRDIHILIT